MSLAGETLSGRLARSGGLIATGLAVEATSLLWGHPTSFLLFLFVGATLVGAGVLLYLWSIARA